MRLYLSTLCCTAAIILAPSVTRASANQSSPQPEATVAEQLEAPNSDTAPKSGNEFLDINFKKSPALSLGTFSPAARDCDTLAASPLDVARPSGVQGVALKDIEFTAALKACQATLKEQPDNARIIYQVERVLYASGELSNMREAITFLQIGAEKGNALAQQTLAVMYQYGEGGLTADDAVAVMYYKLAAEQGVSFAQNNLGRMYEEARGGLPSDAKEAVRLYRLAAEQGNPPAQLNLARMYEEGSGGLARNKSEAVRLYTLAAKAGNETARAQMQIFLEGNSAE